MVVFLCMCRRRAAARSAGPCGLRFLSEKKLNSQLHGLGCVNSRNPVSIVDGCVRRRIFSADFRMEKTKKNTFFQKRTGEVIENKGSGPKSEPERTGNRSGEVVENTFLWKKRTENEPENKLAGALPLTRRHTALALLGFARD